MRASFISLENTPLGLHRVEPSWRVVGPFAWMLIPTTLSCLLFASTANEWTFSTALYQVFYADNATAQLFLQAIASVLGFIQISTICRLVNYATRLRLQHGSMSLEKLQFWTGLSNRRIEWSVQYPRIPLLVTFALLTTVPAAVWAGALTPIPTSKTTFATMVIPQFANMTLLKEYPSEADAIVPDLRDEKGYFSYSVGMKYLGQLLSTASTATSLMGGARNQSKFDNTDYVYHGRSYGVGSSVGLVDDAFNTGELIRSYSFQETGYQTMVYCIYNKTSDFTLKGGDGDGFQVLSASGFLPNSNLSSFSEQSTYVGWSSERTVAIGVASVPTDSRRYLAIASGTTYPYLNNTQCELAFVPTLFNIAVDTVRRVIEVVPGPVVSDFEPTHNLTQVMTRQFELVANDQTSLYTSIVGDSLNNSIVEWQMAAKSTGATPSLQEAVLAGVENSVTAMADAMLVSYASAQLMIVKDTHAVSIEVALDALRPGQDVYIYVMFVFNMLIILVFLSEGMRTRWWTQMLRMDCANASHLILATSAAADSANVDAYTAWKHDIEAPALISGVDELSQFHISLKTGSKMGLQVTRAKAQVS